VSRLEHSIATSTHAIDEGICDAIIIVDESGQGQASFFSQRIFQRGSARRHFICAKKQRNLEQKKVLAGRSEVKEQERRRGMNENRGMRCAGLDNSTKKQTRSARFHLMGMITLDDKATGRQ
jgi:hypothetical protein